LYDLKANGDRHPRPLEDQTTFGMRAGAAEDELSSSIKYGFHVIRKRLWVILVVSTVLVGIALGISFVQTPIYESSIKILVGQRSGIAGSPADVTGLQQLTQTMAEGLSSRRVAEGVIRREGLQMSPEDFLDHLSVEQINATQFIQVTYTDTNPQRAQRVANTVGEVFSTEISRVSPGTTTVSARVWDRAVAPKDPVSPYPLRNGLFALVIGLTFGIGLAYLLEYLDDSWRSAEEVEQLTRVPIYGVIPIIAHSTGKRGGS
jgi:capsular polysaccharide biosynthesis protein